MPTSTLIPTATVTYTLNGTALSSFPNTLVENWQVTYTDNRPGASSWSMSGSAPGPTSPLGYTGTGVLLETFSSGVKQYNALWSSPNPSQYNLSSYDRGNNQVPGGFSVNCYYTLTGAYPSSVAGVAPALGAASLDLKAYAAAGVAKIVTPGTGTTTPTYVSVPNVGVAVWVQHTDGRVYKILDPTLGSTTANAVPSVRPFTSAYDYYVGTATSPARAQLFQNTGSSGTGPFFAGTPGIAYDPYFGRNPTDLKNVQTIFFTLTFPSGKTWTAPISCLNNSVNNSGRLSTTLNTTNAAAPGTVIRPYGGTTTGVGINYYNVPQQQAAAGNPRMDAGQYAFPADVFPFTGGLLETSWNGDDGVNSHGQGAIGLNGIFFLFVLDAAFDDSTIPGPSSGPTVASMSLAYDAARRPLALTAGAGVTYKSSKDAGHTYDSYTVTSATAVDPSLLVDRHCNTFRAIYTDTPASGVANFFYSTSTHDGEQAGDWSPSTAIAGLHGAYPCCAQHPTDTVRVLMAYLDGGVLKTAISHDLGLNWAVLSSSIDTGLDFSSAGRPGLCWLGGETCLVIYASGNNLLARKSIDGGRTFGAAVIIAALGPYSGISADSHAGTAFATGTTGGAAKVWTTGDLGANWTLDTSPTAANPCAIDCDPITGRLRFATSLVSNSGGATWVAA